MRGGLPRVRTRERSPAILSLAPAGLRMAVRDCLVALAEVAGGTELASRARRSLSGSPAPMPARAKDVSMFPRRARHGSISAEPPERRPDRTVGRGRAIRRWRAPSVREV